MKAYAKTTTPQTESDLWETPPEVFECVQRFLGIDFVFDVCALERSSKCGALYFGPDHQHELFRDALSIEWHSILRVALPAGIAPQFARAVWMNPPYSDPMTWAKKAAEEARHGMIVVGLLPDDRSTRWYQEYVEGEASLALIPDRRISFLLNGTKTNGNPKGSVFPVWTPWHTGSTQYVRFKLPTKERR